MFLWNSCSLCCVFIIDAKVMCEDQCHPNELRTGVVTLAESVPRSPVVISVASGN